MTEFEDDADDAVDDLEYDEDDDEFFGIGAVDESTR
jgi:hypothetical protein